MTKQKLSKLNHILQEYVTAQETYYRRKLLSNCSLKAITQESMKRNDLPILRRLILREFPQHRDFILKHVMVQ